MDPFWSDILNHRDVLWNVLLELPYTEVLETGSHSKIGQEILKDPAFWRSRFAIYHPKIYEKVHNLLPPDFDWKKANSYGLSDDETPFQNVRNITFDHDDTSLSAGDFINAIIDSMFQLQDFKDMYSGVIGDYIYPPNTLPKLIRKIMEIEPDLRTPKVFSNRRYGLLVELIALTFQADDLELLRELLAGASPDEISENSEIFFHWAQSIKALDQIMTPENRAKSLEAAARICESTTNEGSNPVPCFQDFVKRHEIGVDDLKRKLPKIAHRSPSIVKYLVGTLGLSPIEQDTLAEAVTWDQTETVKYLLSTGFYDPAKGSNSSALYHSLNSDHYPSWLRKASPEENYQFFTERKKIFELLIFHPTFDEKLANLNRPTKDLNPYVDKVSPTGLESRINEMNLLVADWLRLIIHRLDIKITNEMISDVLGWENPKALGVLVRDHRVDVSVLKSKIRDPKVLSRIDQVRADLLWSLRRIHTLDDLSNQEKYELMMSLESEGKLEPSLSSLLENPSFVDAYLSDSISLAQMLNDRGLTVSPNVNHAAAAALYANDIEIYNSLVPMSSRR